MTRFDNHFTGDFAGRITQAELQELLKKHEDFIGSIKGGRRLMLQFMNLCGLDFSKHNLTGAILTGSALIQANFERAILDQANLFGCDLRDANLDGASLKRTDLRGACARGARLNNADMMQADLREGQVLTQEPKGELSALYMDVGAPDNEGKADFTNAKMRKTSLSEANAGGADFSYAEMTGARLLNANLKGANLKGANLDMADLSGANLTNANLENAQISGAKTVGTEWQGANVQGVVGRGDVVKDVGTLVVPLAELIQQHMLWVRTAGHEGQALDLSSFDMRKARQLQNAALTAIKAEQAIFYGMDLTGAQMQHAHLAYGDFRDCQLKNVDFRGSDLNHAKFARANCQNANFEPLMIGDQPHISNLSGANCRGADFRGANLKYVNFEGADLSQALFEGANLNHANLTGAKLQGTNLAQATTVETVGVD